MATNPILLAPALDEDLENEPMMTREESWALLESLFGSAKEMYAAVGGSDAFMKAERDAWGDGE